MCTCATLAALHIAAHVLGTCTFSFSYGHSWQCALVNDYGLTYALEDWTLVFGLSHLQQQAISGAVCFVALLVSVHHMRVALVVIQDFLDVANDGIVTHMHALPTEHHDAVRLHVHVVCMDHGTWAFCCMRIPGQIPSVFW